MNERFVFQNKIEKSCTLPSHYKEIDIIKAISIIFVVLGHTYDPFCNKFVYLFHVSAFYIAAGFCYNEKYSESFKSVLTLMRKRIYSLWIPYMAYNIVFLCLQNAFVGGGVLTDDHLYFELNPLLPDGFCKLITLKQAATILLKMCFFIHSRPFMGALWFLGGLFYVTVFYAGIDWLLKKINSQKFHIIFSVLFLITGFLIKNHYPSFKPILIVMCTEVLFAAGVYIKQYNFLELLKKVNVFLLLGITFFILLFLTRYGRISIASVNLVNPLFFIVSSLTGFLFLWSLSQVILMYSKFFVQVLLYIGSHTIPILALHILSFKIITFVQMKIYSADHIVFSLFPVWKNEWYWCFAYTVVGVAIPIIISILLGHVKLLRKIFKF
ncbi:acyltransferase family protein [Treponema brennaborense]|uniref:Acyltransferase 3 domain-containing protein n=1 Tax=Treponema brennaborense (strain DSM 12168 / CIP 105900 / DD5/3) TaxID=906968 RepID=F4LPR2_TREBD|nr:acyltransferase family protein [Treponema brennaborense]AEE17058.1 hypothetical protein Trebr_1635 [Treponema brennaborense DSM 12168]